jgi:hypothetical protein
MRSIGRTGGFGSARERREADLFYADLIGRPRRRSRARGEHHEGIHAEQPAGNRIFPDPRRGVDALWRHHQQQQGGVVTRCGFPKPAGDVRTEAEVRAAIVAAARAESTRWHNAGAPIFESNATMFGNLVRYYLAVIPGVRPDTLRGLQTAADSTTLYGALPAATAAADVTREVQRVRGVLIAAATNTSVPPGLAALVETALRQALDAHRDTGAFAAWSAVFVCACVRQASIGLALEDVAGTTIRGRDSLLLSTTRHWEYAAEAHRRTTGPNQRLGTYRAFDPTQVAPEPGDIIVMDRTPAGGFTFARMPPAAMNTHGDIVVEVNAGDVVTLGGNLGPTPLVARQESVRQRRFPRDANGRLIVAANRLFTQEDNTGSLPALPLPITAAARLDDKSTGRIFTLLKLVQACYAIPGQPYRGGVLT